MKQHVSSATGSAIRSHRVRRLLIWIMAACMAVLPLCAFPAVFVSVAVAPPPLPIYAQPFIPGPGYIWTPGYWDYGDGDYFWVPGTWVLAPYSGALWTPGYWGWNDGFYVFHGGYWGPHVGFYGGINYGYGYGGVGYAGGYWERGAFRYNRAVNNINSARVTNVYTRAVVNNGAANHVSYNGGTGGIRARPTAQEQSASRERHMPPVSAQQQHVRMAGQNTALRASVNHGTPSVAATPRPGVFSGRGVVTGSARPDTAETRPARTGQTGATNAPASRGASRAAQTDANARRSATFAPAHRGVASQNGAPAGQQSRGPSAQSNREMPTNRPARQTTEMSRPAQSYSPRQAAPSTNQPRQQAQPRGQPSSGGNRQEHGR